MCLADQPCCTIRRSPSVSCSRQRRHSFARTKPSTGLRQDYCICIIRDCVPRNFCPTYESENSVCPPSPILPSFFCRHLPGRTSSLFLFKELHQSHFAPGPCFSSRWQLLAALRANSRRYRLPLSPSSFGSILSRPPSFYSLDVSSREEKNSRSVASRSSV